MVRKNVAAIAVTADATGVDLLSVNAVNVGYASLVVFIAVVIVAAIRNYSTDELSFMKLGFCL